MGLKYVPISFTRFFLDWLEFLSDLYPENPTFATWCCCLCCIIHASFGLCFCMDIFFYALCCCTCYMNLSSFWFVLLHLLHEVLNFVAVHV